MTTPSLPRLEDREELREFLFHLRGLLDAQDRITMLLKKLDEKLLADPDGAAESLSFLEVEVFDHLAYHLKELREPFSKFLASLYSLGEPPAD